MSEKELNIFEVELPYTTPFYLAVKDNEIQIRGHGLLPTKVRALPHERVTQVSVRRDLFAEDIINKPIEERRVSNREAFERLVGIFCKKV